MCVLYGNLESAPRPARSGQMHSRLAVHRVLCRFDHFVSAVLRVDMVCGCARTTFGQVYANVSIEIRDILRQHNDVSMAFSRHHRAHSFPPASLRSVSPRVSVFKCCGRAIAGCVRAQNGTNVRLENSSICINLENYTTCDCCHSEVTFMHCALRRSVVTRSCRRPLDGSRFGRKVSGV